MLILSVYLHNLYFGNKIKKYDRLQIHHKHFESSTFFLDPLSVINVFMSTFVSSLVLDVKKLPPPHLKI